MGCAVHKLLIAALASIAAGACAPVPGEDPGGPAQWLSAPRPPPRRSAPPHLLRPPATRAGRAPPQSLEDHRKLLARLEAEPRLYGKVQVTKFNAGRHDVAPPGSADFVLTFRNLHNWIERNEVEGALRAFHRALKPGGVLGVVDHRGRSDRSQEAQMKSGYLRQDVAVARIEKAGVRLAGP